jgi:antitoxin (DNA-binding transcriptional repressor) of toxin-antitoxin stability system
MVSKTYDISKAQKSFNELITLLNEGLEVILKEGEVPIARLLPIRQRIAGLHQGSIWMSDDFDEPLPDSFWTGEK